MKGGVAPPTTISSDLLADVGLCVLTTLGYTGKKSRFPGRGSSTKGHRKVPLNLKLQPPPGHFQIPCPWFRRPKGFAMVAGYNHL